MSIAAINSQNTYDLADAERAPLDQALAELKGQQTRWAATSATQRASVIRDVSETLESAAPGWVAASLEAQGISADAPAAGEQWLTGPYITARSLRLLRRSLGDIATHGAPRLPGRPYLRDTGQVVAQVFPTDVYDRLMFLGYRAEVWMQPGVTLEELPRTLALAYRTPAAAAKVCLVLGAGNVSSIGPTDAFYKLFVENQVVLLKLHPVNEYLRPHLEAALRPLIAYGVLRIVSGGASVGAYLCHHPDVDDIHITGSEVTHDAIVFGTGEQQHIAKAGHTAVLKKRVTSELGNVSAVVIVPGQWRTSDLPRQAENIASMLVNNAGFNCNAVRMIVTHRRWPQREEFLNQLRRILSSIPPRVAYYPGAKERFAEFVAEHPEAERIGTTHDDRHLPWTLITNLDASRRDDICFRREAFCPIAGETALDAGDAASFVDRAVEFVNDALWGSLNTSLIVDPKSLRAPEVRDAVERAIARLRVGTVALNHWAGVSYAVCSTTWGAFPGHPLHDIQSGQGVVHNSFMFSRAEKSVLYGPFRPWPKPPWFVSHRQAARLGPKLVAFECHPSLLRLPAIFRRALEL